MSLGLILPPFDAKIKIYSQEINKKLI